MAEILTCIRISARRLRFPLGVGVLVALTVETSDGAFAQDVRAHAPSVSVTDGGLTEQSVALRAIEVSSRLRAADASVMQAEQERRSRASDFAPRLDLTASYHRLSRVDLPEFEFQGADFDNPFPQILNQYAFRADLTVSLTDYFLLVRPRHRAARESVEIAEFEAESRRFSEALRARTTLLEYGRMLAAERVAEAAATFLDSQVRRYEALREEGLATDLDVLQTQAQRGETRIQLARIRGEVRLGEATLRQILRLSPDDGVTLGEDVGRRVTIPGDELEELQEQAIAQRSDVRAMERSVDVNRLRESALAGARWPSVSLVAGVDYANPNERVFPLEERFETTWDVGVVARWSPNDFAAGTFDSRASAAESARIEAELAELKMEVAIQVAEAHNRLTVAAASVSAAEEGIAAAREARRVQSELLAAGETTATELLDSEASLLRAELNLIDARIDARVALARLERAVGRRPEGAE